jgi:hypothetical protein
MGWINMVAVVAIVLVTALEAWRRFGKALFDVIGVLVSVQLAHLAQPGVASLVSFSADRNANQATAFAVTFGVLVILTVVASKYLYAFTLLALPDAFEGTGGAVLGFVSAIAVAHAVVWTAYTAGGGAAATNPYAQTFAVQQLVQWQAYHQVLYALKHLGE